ncbi:MAG: YdeI/OmpD-associated family protein [Spirosomataceae bacterium]
MEKNEPETFCPASRQEWREWLQENHLSQSAVWLVYYKKKSNVASITWSEAVDEALCFGWIDSKAQTLDDEKFRQFFSKRKPKSVWSKINKEKIQRLTADGLIAPAGYEIIETAKQNGSWSILDEVEELVIPADLASEFETRPGSGDFFLSLSKSVRKAILQWLVLAKQPETRRKRLLEIAERAALQQKPKQF